MISVLLLRQSYGINLSKAKQKQGDIVTRKFLTWKKFKAELYENVKKKCYLF